TSTRSGRTCRSTPTASPAADRESSGYGQGATPPEPMTRDVNATRRLPAVLLVLLLSTASLSMLAITPAVADTTVDCGATPSDPACSRVEPLLTCVWTDASGGLTAVFG